MKLKTLKDLNQFGAEPIIEGLDSYSFVRTELLKAEAIKWVKMMMRGREGKTHTYIEDFKMFHNITSEDLK